jgi:hypothetical protein
MKRFLHVIPLLLAACASTPAASTPTTLSQTGEREHAMANCPNAVAGARTSLSMIEDGVEMLITAETSEARHEIELRADKHLRMGDPAGQAPEHTGLHGGPGWMGHCPIIHDATTVSVRRIPNGVVVRVRALIPDAVKTLQEETRSRVAGLRAHR